MKNPLVGISTKTLQAEIYRREKVAGKLSYARMQKQMDIQGKALAVGCFAGKDGDCVWKKCPQILEGEPRKSGRHCPRDTGDDDEC